MAGGSQPSPLLMYGAGLAILTSILIMAFTEIELPADMPAGALDRDDSLELCAGNGLERKPSSIPGAGGGIFASKPFKRGNYVCFFDGFDQETLDEDTDWEYTLHHQHGDGHRVGYKEPYHPCGVGQLINDAAMIDVSTRTATLEEVYEKIRRYKERGNEIASLAWMQDDSNPFMLFATRDINVGEELFVSYGPAYWLGDLDDQRKYPTPMGKLLGCIIYCSWREVVTQAEAQPTRGGMTGHLRKTCVTLTKKDDDGNLRVLRPGYDHKTKTLKLLTPQGTYAPLDDNAAEALMADFLRLAPSSTLWSRLDEAIASGDSSDRGATSKASSSPTASLSPKGKLRRLVAHLTSGGRAIDHPFELASPFVKPNEEEDDEESTAEAGSPKPSKQGKRRKGKRKAKPRVAS